MPPYKIGIMIVVGFALAACQTEAGYDSAFPPIGGARPMTMPAAGTPTNLTPDPAAPAPDGSTAALTNAVNDALAATAPPPPPARSTPVEAGSTTPPAPAAAASVANLSAPAQPATPSPAPAQVVIQPGQMPDVVAGVNIITYARQTTNAVGERLYRRPTIRRSLSASQCRKFASPDDAQRNFLANGGPQDDPLNLDPDGDGFACRWSPEAYRALRLN